MLVDFDSGLGVRDFERTDTPLQCDLHYVYE
jgi:hypothetical protein